MEHRFTGPSYTLGIEEELMIVDADNLTIREQLRLRENLAGRSVLNKAADTMYAISVSGVTVMSDGTNWWVVNNAN